MQLLDGIEVACFDLFDTLIRIDTQQLPRFEWKGREMRTTLPLVHQTLFEARDVSLEDFMQAIQGVWQETRARFDAEAAEGRYPEIPAADKYRRLAERLGLEEDGDALAGEVADRHHGALVSAAVAADGAGELLARIRKRGIPTVLVSNWDHASAGPAMLAQTGLADLLDEVVISEALGVRKPDSRIFEVALEPFGANPDAALHVGDLAKADVWGAGRLGFRTVWINHKDVDYLEADHPPTHTVGRLAELLEWV